MSDMLAVGDKSVNDKCATECGGLFGPSYEVVDADRLQQAHLNKVRSQLTSDEDGISETVRCSRGMYESMVEDLELFVTSSRPYDKGGNDDDDEPNCLGVGEGITIRKRANKKSEMSIS
ncbi:hypothetical protein ACFE04_027144 [Oxalis oulophora]